MSDRALVAEQARLLFSNARSANVALAAVMVPLSLAFAESLPWGQAATGLGFIASMALLRAVLAQTYLRRPGAASPRRWLRRYTLASAALGVGGAAMAFAALPRMSLDFQLLAVFVYAAMSSAAVSVSAAWLPSFRVFAHPPAVAFAAHFALAGELPLLAGIAAYALVVGRAAEKNGETWRTAQELRFRLRAERDRAEALNRSLEEHREHLEEAVAGRTAELSAAKEAAVAASSAKSRFLANVSHELRTPLNAVIGMSDLLRPMVDDEEQRDLVATIHESGEHLLALVNDLLDFSKLEAGRMTLRQVPFDLGELLRRTAAPLSEIATRKDLRFECVLPPEERWWALGDPLRVRQVITNLVANAIKFTDRGDVRLTVDVAAEGERIAVRFEVSDTGIGIPPEEVERIFESFTQIDDGRNRRFGGAGLGLAIAHQLVELMGGSIAVASQVDAGSHFSFEVRFEPAPKPTRLASAATATGVAR